MGNIFGKIAGKIKAHYEKSGLLESGGKIHNPWKTKLFIVLMLFLPISQFIVFTIYVNIDGIIMTFQNVDFATNELLFVGFGNYEKFFRNFISSNNELFLKSIWNSFGFWPLTFFIMVPLQVLAAYVLYKKTPAAGFIIVIIFLPNLIPPAVLTQAFKEMLSIRQGPLNDILMYLFGYTKETVPIWLNDEKYAMIMIYVYSVWVGIGYNAVLLWGAMTRVPVDIVESAHLEGISFFREFFQITIPIIWPTMSIILITSVSIPFAVYMQPLLLTGGLAGTGTLSLMAILALRGGDMYYSATISVILSLVSIPLMLGAKSLLNRMFEDVEV